MKRYLYLICLLIIVTACKEVFEAPPQALLQASFFSSTSKKESNPVISLLGIGRETDSLLYKEEASIRALFPLTIKDTTRFIIWFDSKSDSITFVHTTIPKYDSMETGFYYEYELQSVIFTHNRIDSLIIVDSLVTKKWNENIKLYIKPLPAGSN